MIDEMFWEIHSDLPREGPGDDESTRRAYAMMTGLPDRPRILDVACGPGMQTMELANISQGPITAVDTHQEFLDELQRRSQAAGVSDRVRTLNASMFTLPFDNNSFDVIWCEGAMYIMGVREALADWTRFLSDSGYIAFTEPCFRSDDVPIMVRELWQADYPGMTTVKQTLKIIEASGYQNVGNFPIPDSAWWNDYYKPQEARLEMLREKYRENPTALERIEHNQQEIDAHRLYHQYYCYEFFVIRR
jgi:ubiquinone/menaquinone biosynthesis C-methylase UbiE